MANKRSRSRKSSNSRTKSRRRKQCGGNTAGPAPPSAWGHAMNTVGDGWKQFQDSLTLQPGQNLASSQSNDLVPIGKMNAQNAQPMLKPNMSGGKGNGGGYGKPWGSSGGSPAKNAAGLSAPGATNQYGSGKRRRRKSAKGGSWEAVAAQALVPGFLLGAQQLYGRRLKSRKH